MKQQETNSDFLAVHEDVVKRVLDMLYWKLNCV